MNWFIFFEEKNLVVFRRLHIINKFFFQITCHDDSNLFTNSFKIIIIELNWIDLDLSTNSFKKLWLLDSLVGLIYEFYFSQKWIPFIVFGKGIVLNCVRKKLKRKKSLKVEKVHERWKRKEVALVHRSTITFSANKENYTTTVLAKVFSVIPNLVQSTRSSYILLKTFIPFILFLSR